MKIGYFQKTISSLSLAVLTGVVLFSVGSGTSATPEYSPPGTGVKPTFYGAKMLGAIENPNGNVVVDGDFQVKKIPGSALDKGDLTVDGGVYLNNAGGGGINLGSSDGTSKIYVRGALDFMNNDVTKNVINSLIKIISHDTTNGLVLQAPGVRITLNPNKGVDITNATSMGASNGSKDLKGEMNVTVQGNIDLTGKIKDTAGDGTIKLENHLDVLGTVSAGTVDADKIKNGTVDDGGWVTVDDKFAVTQNSNFKGNVVIENTLSVWDAVNSSNGLIQTNKIDVTGTVSADNLNVKMGMTFAYSGSKPTGSAYESFIYHYADPKNGNDDNLIIQSNDNIKLVTNPDWASGPGTVKVEGKLVATKGIGTYTRRESTSVSVSSGSTSYTSKGCNVGEIAISCGVYPSSYKLYNSYFYTNAAMTTCYAGVHNTDSATKTFKVYANCFNPAI